MAAAYTEDIPLDRNGQITVYPGDFLLGITRERIRLPRKSKIAARVEGRSTLARLGLSVHLTAPTVQLGFRGCLALELKNHGDPATYIDPGNVDLSIDFRACKGAYFWRARFGFPGTGRAVIDDIVMWSSVFDYLLSRETVQILATLALIFVTTGLWRATRSLANTSRKGREDAIRPLVVVKLKLWKETQ